jgi:dihydroorotase
MTTELLRQVRLLDPQTQRDEVVDILIHEGQIAAIASVLDTSPEDAQVIDGTGCILGPGLMDLYSTVGEPGFESRETLRSIAAAAAAGGFTRIALLPNTHPVLDHPEQVDWMQSHWPPDNPVKLDLWGALTRDLVGEQLVELAELATAGICGFSDGHPLNNWLLLRRGLEYLHPLRQPLMLWPCDRSLAGDGVIRGGRQALETGLIEAPIVSETAALAAILELVASTQTPVHIMRLSTARSVELIAQAKDRQLPITASVTWLHLLHNSDDLRTYDVNLRLDPPLGNPEDQAALIQGVEKGVIDAIAIDHRAYTYEEKTIPFAEAPPGAIGLELALPVLWQTFVETGCWSPLFLWTVLSQNPRHCLNLHSPPITVGQPAELTLYHPSQSWLVRPEQLNSLGRNTSYQGKSLMGRVCKTWNGFASKS